MRCFYSKLLVWFAIGIALTAPLSHVLKQPIWSSFVTDGTPMALSTSLALMSISAAALLKFHKPKNKQ